MAKTGKEDAQIDMTPMIDVVFQLIIFFIVTIQMEKEYNRQVEMERAPHGPIIKGEDPATLVIEIDRRGWLSIHGAQLNKLMLRDIIRNRYDRYGTFPILIRADKRTKHADVRNVMDLCTDAGLWRINFAAIQEKKM